MQCDRPFCPPLSKEHVLRLEDVASRPDQRLCSPPSLKGIFCGGCACASAFLATAMSASSCLDAVNSGMSTKTTPSAISIRGTQLKRGGMSARPLDAASLYAAHVPGSIPPRRLNGGLYTGEPFAGDWGNVPIVPDAGYIANNRYFYAHHQPVSWPRRGNNSPIPRDAADVQEFPDLVAVFPASCATIPPALASGPTARLRPQRM